MNEPMLWTARTTFDGYEYMAQGLGESACSLLERLNADDPMWVGASLSLERQMSVGLFSKRGLAIKAVNGDE